MKNVIITIALFFVAIYVLLVYLPNQVKESCQDANISLEKQEFCRKYNGY